MMMDRGNLAKEYFMQGYNCAQSVLLAFSDVTGLDEDFAAKMASSFGGGIGRLREVCGAVSSMMTVFGIWKRTTESGKFETDDNLSAFCQYLRGIIK